ncbi:C45 family autoproteolytic acyltransferase/hydolase [Halotalea alkalilenta]|uniref:C45 family autoproteolytic acyltransferase/hydolase n=1 Tax=Halotalea alkalilenta TaxID=376489 RepID=UPI0006931FAC|nr:C45 family peptidase [Halotalea alkalilenta]
MIKHIEASGSHYQLGLAHGREAAQEIRLSLSNYAQLFDQIDGITWSEARTIAEGFKAPIEACCPELLEEMAGIALGAKVDPLDVLVLNARSEIALTRAEITGRPAQSDGCSAFSERHGQIQWLAQNWDWKPEQQAALIRLTLRPAPSLGKPALTLITEAGIIGKIGFNAAGVGVCLNALRSALCRPKVPIHVLLRRVLECGDAPSAQARIESDGAASPAHLLIADGDCHAVAMEVSPLGGASMLPRGGRLCHTNHLISRFLPPGLEDAPSPDSFARLARLEQLGLGEAPSFASLRARLCDRDGAPNAISREVDPAAEPARRSATLFTIVMNLTERRAEFSLGRPDLDPPIETLTID